MKQTIIVLSILITIIAGIIILRTNQSTDFLKQEGLDGLDTVEMVELLEARTIDPNHYIASISGTELKIITAKETYSFLVPHDLFYLSIAPYIQSTHACSIHNLTTCRGELKNKVFDVEIRDLANNLVISRSVVSEDNGFAGIWLPRNMEGSITVYYQGLISTRPISTFDDSFTCLTTLELRNP